MKSIIYLFLILFLLNGCSFDRKTGIWKNKSDIISKAKKKQTSKNIQPVFKQDTLVLKEISANQNYLFKNLFNNLITDWAQENYNNQNNIENINYSNKKELIFKSKKIPGKNINSNFFYENKNIIYLDDNGSIYVFSISKNKIIFKYNFYKKKYKKIKKKLNLIIKANVIYVSDNIGYIYAIDYTKQKILWAKEVGIPFKSNIKIYNDQLILSTDTNKVFSLNIYTGSTNWDFISEAPDVQGKMKNNFSLDEVGNLTYMNTNNSIYSWDLNVPRLSWLVNLRLMRENKGETITSLKELVISRNKVLVSSNKSLYLYDSFTGDFLWSKQIKPRLKPLISNDNVFIITDDNFIVNISLFSGEIIWAKKIQSIFRDYKNKKILSKIGKIHYYYISNNSLLLLSSKYILELDISNNPKIKSISKFKFINSNIKPIFIEGSMFIIKGKRIYKFN